MSENRFISFRSQILNRKSSEDLIGIYFTLELNGTHQRLPYADDIDACTLGENKTHRKEG
jgi:hypothetical protein